MTDKVAKLGVSTSTASATVYTVPAAKCARHRLMWRGTFTGGAQLDIFVNGIKIATKTALTGEYYSTTTALIAGTTTPDGSAATLTVAPYATEYFSDTTDIVNFVITGTCTAMNFQVVGGEFDR